MLKLASVAAVGGAGAAGAISLATASPAAAQEADVGVLHFFSNGTYTIQDTGAYAIYIIGAGGGGGGGGSSSGIPNQVGGGGGGAGSYIFHIAGANAGDVVKIQVGIGGPGGPGGPPNGNPGQRGQAGTQTVLLVPDPNNPGQFNPGLAADGGMGGYGSLGNSAQETPFPPSGGYSPFGATTLVTSGGGGPGGANLGLYGIDGLGGGSGLGVQQAGGGGGGTATATRGGGPGNASSLGSSAAVASNGSAVDSNKNPTINGQDGVSGGGGGGGGGGGAPGGHGGNGGNGSPGFIVLYFLSSVGVIAPNSTGFGQGPGGIQVPVPGWVAG
jgi:hypothetical protein